MEKTRKPAVAGAFYPGDPDELKDMVERFLNEAEDTDVPGKLRALIVPHAGYVYSGPVAAYAYKLLQKHADELSRVIMIGPSHFAGFFGTAESDSDKWQTPLGMVKAGSLKHKIKDLGMINVIPEAHMPEHNLEVQIPFLQMVLEAFTIYPLLTGDIRPAALAEEIVKALDEKTLIIISSDLSHYFPYEKAVKLDTVTNNAIKALDIETMKAKGDACGKTGILVLLHIAKKMKWKCKLLNYRNSGDTAGPKSEVVGYSAFAFYEE